jgi:hypothetical protein
MRHKLGTFNDSFFATVGFDGPAIAPLVILGTQPSPYRAADAGAAGVPDPYQAIDASGLGG